MNTLMNKDFKIALTNMYKVLSHTLLIKHSVTVHIYNEIGAFSAICRYICQIWFFLSINKTIKNISSKRRVSCS